MEQAFGGTILVLKYRHGQKKDGCIKSTIGDPPKSAEDRSRRSDNRRSRTAFAWSSSAATVTNATLFWRLPSVSRMMGAIVGLEGANACFGSSGLFPSECRERTQCHTCASAVRAMGGAPASDDHQPTVPAVECSAGSFGSVKLHKPILHRHHLAPIESRESGGQL
jgi:hypothetical protein